MLHQVVIPRDWSYSTSASRRRFASVSKVINLVGLCPDQGLQREVLQGIRQLCHELKSQGLPGHLLQRQLGSHLYWEDDEEKLALEVALLAHNNASPADPDLMDMVSEYFGYDGLGKTTVPLILGEHAAIMLLGCRHRRFDIYLASISACMQKAPAEPYALRGCF